MKHYTPKQIFDAAKKGLTWPREVRIAYTGKNKYGETFAYFLTENANSVDEYKRFKRAAWVCDEDIANGLARQMGWNLSEIHISKNGA